MSSEPSRALADLLVVAMAREIRDGELLAQGIGTHLPTCAYFLAKRTHAPSCRLLYSIGGTISDRIGPISLGGFERLALTAPLRRVGYAELICDTLAGLPFKEFSRPAQVDRYGNTNNTVIGPYAAPKLRLPGAGGIPDFSPYGSHHSLLYVPRHDRRTLVDRLDFRSGIGRLAGESDEQRGRLGVTGRGARRLITDLGIFAFGSTGAVLEALHPDVDLQSVIAATGFRFDLAADLQRTAVPTVAELALIDELDPDRIRELEFLPSADRYERIRELAGSAA